MDWLRTKGYWFNYIKQDYELRDAPTSDQDALELLPQYPSAHELYLLHRQMGAGIIEAMHKVLLACVQPENKTT